MSYKAETLEQDAGKLTKKSRSNFYFSFLFLPKEKREAIYAVYAFCRVSDDIADEAVSKEEKARQIAEWRRRLDACYAGKAETRVMRALARAVRRYNIPRQLLEELISGVEMDLFRNRYDTFEELYTYCYRVASVVGLICIEVFGYENPATKRFAECLGIALQLTNIMRDVGVDARQGRIHIPGQDLKRFNVSEDEILQESYSHRFLELMRFQDQRAEHFYRLAAEALPEEDRHRMVAAEIMAAIYHQLLVRIRQADYDVFNHVPALPDWYKFLIAFRTWFWRLLWP